MTIAKLIRTNRLANGYTQAELAHRLGVCGQTISNIERDLASLSSKHFPKCSEVLNIPKRELIRAATTRFKRRLNQLSK